MTDSSFGNFESRAKAGDRLTVVFLGGSITWGAGASDPQKTSYRPRLAAHLSKAYPEAKFQFIDAAVGGTGSQTAVFRVGRDVLRYQPDLVLLDYSLNDGLENNDMLSLASYEAILRRLLRNGVLVLQVIFPDHNVTSNPVDLPRRQAHLRLAEYYGTPVADVIEELRWRVKNQHVNLDVLWPSPTDKCHPGDAGYAVYADIVWAALSKAMTQCVRPRFLSSCLFEPLFEHVNRLSLASAFIELPSGWRVNSPASTSPVGDMIMSRWLDNVVVAEPGADTLRLRFKGTFAMLLGESTLRSGKYEIQIDNGQPVGFDASQIARTMGGNAHHFPVLATNLDAAISHELWIRPLLETNQELRFESLCTSLPGLNDLSQSTHALTVTLAETECVVV